MLRGAETSKKKNKKKASETEVLSWRQKKELADREEAALEKQIEEIMSWTAMVEAMSSTQLKEYAINRPEALKSAKTGKDTQGTKKKRNGKLKSSASSSSQGIMATVWKFHKEDDEEACIVRG